MVTAVVPLPSPLSWFLSSSDVETSQKALRLVHGYRGLGKPLVVEFGREQNREKKKPDATMIVPDNNVQPEES